MKYEEVLGGFPTRFSLEKNMKIRQIYKMSNHNSLINYWSLSNQDSKLNRQYKIKKNISIYKTYLISLQWSIYCQFPLPLLWAKVTGRSLEEGLLVGVECLMVAISVYVGSGIKVGAWLSSSNCSRTSSPATCSCSSSSNHLSAFSIKGFSTSTNHLDIMSMSSTLGGFSSHFTHHSRLY